MVFQKKQDCVSTGYTVPVLPQGSKPIRKKRSNLRKSAVPSWLDPMYLLATVAGMLLVDNGKAPTVGSSTSGDQKASSSKCVNKTDKPSCNMTPAIVEECFQKVCDHRGFVDDLFVKTNTDCLASGSSSIDILKSGSADIVEIKVESPRMEHVMAKAKASSILKENVNLDRKPLVLVSSESSVATPLCRDQTVPNDHCSSKLKDTKMRDRDVDDKENSSVGTNPDLIAPKPFFVQRAGDRKGRKFWSAKSRKFGQAKKDGFRCRDVNGKPIFRSRKACLKPQRIQRSPFQKRTLHERTSIPSSVMGEVTRIETSNQAVFPRGDAVSSMATNSKPSSETEDYKVKFKIKSFKIPELLFEFPEDATIGSLKAAVLEMLIDMLGNEPRVGLIFQGKRVRDDCRTLREAGITGEENLDKLGFTLEPTPSPFPLQLCSEMPTCSSPEPLARLPALPASDTMVVVVNCKADPKESPGTSLDDGDSCLTNASPVSSQNSSPISKALVPVPAATESLALVPHNGKPRRSEVAQRRIRRPFSVAEVEALVRAVEELGTGRWRDVKLQAFENAMHRTYVDLKDKWKTLVHTATISPQQRRGEPVPQELLDRVLAAHAHWTQHQVKIQAKPQTEIKACAF